MHLANIQISEQESISKLGDINLILGGNGIGKSTLLYRIQNEARYNMENGKRKEIPYEFVDIYDRNVKAINHLWRKIENDNDYNMILNLVNHMYKGTIEQIHNMNIFNVLEIYFQIKEIEDPVRLVDIGEGILHVMDIAVKTLTLRNGYLLLDDVEYSIHHSAQYELWKLITTTAQRNNVQVFATTQSWDTISGLAQAISDTDEPIGEVVVIRLERKNGDLKAIEFTQEELKLAVKQGIELR